MDGGVLPADQMRLKCRIDVGLHYQQERHAFNGPKAYTKVYQHVEHDYMGPLTDLDTGLCRTYVRDYATEVRALC